MSYPVVALEQVLTLPLADWLMRERHIRHLPVIDADRRLVGLVTHRTIMAAKHGDGGAGFVFPVSDIMQPDPVTVSADDSAADAARFMVENRIGCAVVVDDEERITGIVTERDFLDLAARALQQSPRVSVDDFMTTDVVTVDELESLDFAGSLMEKGRFRHLPVLDGRGHLVGLVTHRDLLAARFGIGDAERVSDIERRDVWSISSGSSASSAARTLADHEFGCLPVTCDGLLVGLITETDILDLLVRLLTRAGAFRRGHRDKLPLRFYMSAPVHCVDLDTSIKDAREKLSRRLISSLGVVSSTNHLVGIITATDLLLAGDAADDEVVSGKMTRDVVTIDVDTPLVEAAREMAENKIHRVFVTEEDRLAGVVSTSDVVLAVRDMRIHTPLSEIMSPLVLTIAPGETIEAGARFLDVAEIRALIVVEHGWPIGVLDQRRLLENIGPKYGAVIEDVMSSAIINLPATLPAFRAAAQMAYLGVDHVIAMRKGEPVGVVTGLDMARLCANEGAADSRCRDGLAG